MELPEFNSYQLFGASNMVRFCNHQLNLPSKKNGEGYAQIGLCVSGQGIRQLSRRISGKIKLIKKNVLISIGTNDLKKMIRIRQFKIALRVLLSILGNRNIVWLTIPPIPAYGNTHCRMVEQFNNCIKKLIRKNPNMDILDLHSIFLRFDGTTREDLYEEDGINFNKWGITLMAEFLKCKLRPGVAE